MKNFSQPYRLSIVLTIRISVESGLPVIKTAGPFQPSWNGPAAADNVGGPENHERVAATPRRKRVIFAPFRPAAKPSQAAQGPGFEKTGALPSSRTVPALMERPCPRRVMRPPDARRVGWGGMCGEAGFVP
jgi:hypothetical protein